MTAAEVAAELAILVAADDDPDARQKMIAEIDAEIGRLNERRSALAAVNPKIADLLIELSKRYGALGA